MPRTERETEELARKAAERVDRDMQLGEQLGLFPEKAEPTPPEIAPDATAGASGVGRPKGAKNKGSSQMREWLTARNLKMPEQIIAEIAGLGATDKDAFAFALASAERLLAHVGETAENRIWDGSKHVILDTAWQPTPGEFIDTFKFFYAQARQAAADLMPYGTPKAAPDVQVNQNTTVIVPAAPSQSPADPAQTARDVTPQPAQLSGRMMPADVAFKIQQNQELSESDPSEEES